MSDGESTSWIKLPDFTENRVWISAVNTTTQFPVPQESFVEFTELSESKVTLTLPANSCAFGHFFLIQIRLEKKLTSGAIAESENVSFTAKVIEEQPLNPTSKSVTLSLLQFDEEPWKKLLARVENQQNQANQIVGNIRQ